MAQWQNLPANAGAYLEGDNECQQCEVVSLFAYEIAHEAQIDENNRGAHDNQVVLEPIMKSPIVPAGAQKLIQPFVKQI